MPPSKARRSGGDRALGLLARGSAVTILGLLVALLATLVTAGAPAAARFGASFLTETEWRPNTLERPRLDARGEVVITGGEVEIEEVPPRFGALPAIWGTAVSSGIALLIAVPLSLGAALFVVRIAPRLRVAGPLSFMIEFLAAIPSIAYGFWGLAVLTPWLQTVAYPAMERLAGGTWVAGWVFRTRLADGTEIPVGLTGKDMLCGGLVLAIMVIPIVTAVARDVLRSVPRGQLEGTLALGATWWQSSWGMMRYARAGLFGAVMLGLARAAGETMAVTMVIGNNMQVAASPLAPAQTMASLLANEFKEASDQLHQSALLLVALILLVMSLALNVTARSLVVGGSSRTAAAH
ncbi:MAG: phosphate ABC transporter permease subunit PstC [Planctomyces sp.]|nr:phosphate ABC transporter permease subunit PstC [Planctomyces sp.]MBA4119101.1 phosphate ABC transporter permease subunit PstC [Isosphaera sp.]